MPSLHLNPRSKYWYVAYRDADGRRVFKSTKQTKKTDAWRVALNMSDAAETARQGLMTEIHMRKVISETITKIGGKAPNLHTIADWCRSWAADKSVTTAQSTGVRYAPLIEDFLNHLGPTARKDISFLTKIDIQSFRDSGTKQGLSNASVNLAIKALRNCFKIAVQQQIIATNPADAVGLLKKGKKFKKPFTIEQIRNILLVIEDEEWRGLIKVGYYVGSRIESCAKLRHEDIFYEKAVLKYSPNKQRDADYPKVVEIPIHPELMEYFLGRRRATGPVFPRLSKKRVGGKTGLSLTFRSFMEKAGILSPVQEAKGKRGRRVYELGFHSLRHSFNSDLANAGVRQEHRQKMIGHASQSVNDGYTHLEMEEFRSAINKLSRLEGERAS